jgi:hypothetical protein
MAKPKFGTYHDLSVDSYFKLLQNPTPNVVSVIHLYNQVM